MSADPDMASGPRIRRRLAVCAAALVALAALAVWAFELLDAADPLPGFELSKDAVAGRVRSWGAWGVAGSVGLMVLHSFVPFPAEIVAMANGLVYGPVWGTVITWTGAMLGAFLAFGLARWLGRPLVATLVAARHHAAIDRWTERDGTGTLLFSRFVPIISFNLINYAAGLTAVSWWTFAWTTGLGILPITILMVLMGHGLVADEGTAWLWLALAGLAGWLAWTWLRRRHDPVHPR